MSCLSSEHQTPMQHSPKCLPFHYLLQLILALCRDSMAEEQQWCLDPCVEQPSSLEASAGGSLGQLGPSDLRVLHGVLD